MTERTIRVWAFRDAPQEFRALSEHGGDEDWVMHVPASLADEWWVEWSTAEGSPFGCCSVGAHEQPDGSVIYIGAHA